MTSVAKYTKRYSTFRPTDITGCRSWMDSMDTSSYTLSGTTVTAVTDKASGTAFDVAGAPVSTYDGSDKTTRGFNMVNGRMYRNITSMTGYTHSAFFVTKLNSTPSDGSPCLAFTSSSGGASEFYRSLDYAGGNFRTFAFAQSVFGAATSSNTNQFIFSGTYDNSTKTLSSRIFNTGTESPFTATGSSGFSTNATYIVIGADGYIGYTNTYTWPGTVKEVIAYGSVLSVSERRTVEGYLAWKWGLESILSSTHPYKNVPFYTYV